MVPSWKETPGGTSLLTKFFPPTRSSMRWYQNDIVCWGRGERDKKRGSDKKGRAKK